jgi:hypothetical protein
MSDDDHESGLSRRRFLAGGAAGGAALGFGGALGVVRPRTADAARHHDPVAPTGFGGDLLLVNGNIHTMDERNRVVSSALIRGGRFAAVGHDIPRASGAPVINLKGRHVLPGLVDTHNHVVLMGLRPGYHTPLENAYSIDDVQATIAARRAASAVWRIGTGEEPPTKK